MGLRRAAAPVVILLSVGIIPSVGIGAVDDTQTATAPVFDVADLAYLWPPPTDAAGVARLVSAEAASPAGKRLWPADVFSLLLATAQETVVESPGAAFQISFVPFKSEFEKPGTWKLASFRFDPSAPGGHAGFVNQFGATPQLRLVFQPVTVMNGAVQVHDVTAHVAYSFTKAGGTGLPAADEGAVRGLLGQLQALKEVSAAGGAATRGALGVHPALRTPIPGFTDKVLAFLGQAVETGQLTDLAFMGIDPPEPWIFFAMRRRQADGAFVRVGPKALVGRSAQMLVLRGGPPVVPEPAPTNQPPSGGVSTAPLFRPAAGNALQSAVFPAHPRPALQDIPDIVANPEISHVFNTDCVSCHTESTRRHLLKIAPGDGRFRYAVPSGLSGVDPRNLPTDRWNVRNFGWFQRSSGETVATVSQRTANEAADAADFAARTYFGVAPVAADVRVSAVI